MNLKATSPSNYPSQNNYLTQFSSDQNIRVSSPVIPTSGRVQKDEEFELRALRNQVYQLERKVMLNNEQIIKLQGDLQNVLQVLKDSEDEILNKAKNLIKIQMSQLEKRFLDEQKKNKTDILNNKIHELRVEIESRCISLDAQLKIVQSGCESKLIDFAQKLEKMTWTQQGILNSFYIQKKDQPEQLESTELELQRSESQQSFEETYHVDDQGYLMDSQNRYLLDEKGCMVKLTEKQISYLNKQYIS